MGAKGIGVLVLNEVRRSMFEKAQRSRDRDSSGRFVARRTGERRNQGNSQNGRPNDTVVYPMTGHYLTLDFRSGIHSSSRRGQGRKLAETTTPRDEDTALISMQCLKSWMGSIGIMDKTGRLM
jgi:hypothetical protein